MRRSDILLAVLIVGVLVVLAVVGPYMLDAWRATEGTPANRVAEVADDPSGVDQVTEEEAEPEREALDPQTAAEVERVSGMLMLHQACANRFHGFEAENRVTVEAWRRLHADLLAQSSEAEPDFHIVLAEPEPTAGQGDQAEQPEERALCERNVEAMRDELPSE